MFVDVEEAASHGSEPYELPGLMGWLLMFVKVDLKVTILHQSRSNSHAGEVQAGDNGRPLSRAQGIRNRSPL